MPVLDFNSTQNVAPKRSRLLKLLALSALAVVVVLGSTFAANINLNSGLPVEFGQGITMTTACDDSVVLTPQSTFVNEGENSDFLFTSFSITSISSDCDGKTFTIKAFKSDESSPLDLYETEGTTYSEINVRYNDGSFRFANGGLLDDDISDLPDGFLVTLVTSGPPPSVAVASAKDVEVITIESSDSVYEVGDLGPAGGVVIYDAGSTRNWGRYIEVAPENWNGSDGDDVDVPWCSNPFLDVNSATSGIGFAEVNTNQMISPNCTSGVGVIARDYQGGGESDWSVPTLAEMQLISAQANLIPGLIIEGPGGSNGYWVSNGGTGGNSWIGTVQVVGGGPGGVNKAQSGPYLRPIRYF